jgi:GTP-binding protein LepA
LWRNDLGREKQQTGKRKMRQFGTMDIPQEGFISALKMDG